MQTESLTPQLRIRPTRGWAALHLRDFWDYRELLYFLIWREVKIRYKQTVLGVAWVVLQPLAATFLFTLVFGRLAGLPSDNLPYPVFALTGLVAWNYFAGAVGRGGPSLVNSASLISKIYFPRILLPSAFVFAGLVDFAIVFAVLAALLPVYGYLPLWSWLTIPFFLALAVGTALGVSYWASALNVQYRDVGFIVPFLIQLWFFATPVVYSAALVPAPWNALLALNPLASVVQGFRWALTGAAPVPGPLLLVSVGAMLVMLGSGMAFFRRMERTFADVV